MLDTEQNIIYPPTSEGVKILRQWKTGGRPIRLTVNQTMELVVEDTKSFEMLEDLVDRLNCLEDLRVAKAELDQGKGLTVEQVKEEFRKSHDLSR